MKIRNTSYSMQGGVITTAELIKQVMTRTPAGGFTTAQMRAHAAVLRQVAAADGADITLTEEAAATLRKAVEGYVWAFADVALDDFIEAVMEATNV